jgi:Undecaprenyl-phosphate glucose phosphotransferase
MMHMSELEPRVRNMPVLTPMLARLMDLACIVGGALAGVQIRFDDLAQSRFDAGFIGFSAAFALALFPVFGIYESWRGRSMIRMTGQVSLGWLMVQACSLVLMFTLHRSDVVSRLWFIYWTAISGGALIGARLLVHALLGRMRNAGLNLRQVAVVGSGEHFRQLLRTIEGARASGFRTVATLDIGQSADDESLRPLAAFAAGVRAGGVQELWVALPLTGARTLQCVLDEFRGDLVNVRYMPDMRSIALFDSGMISLLGGPAINLIASPLPQNALLQKVVFDKLFSLLAIVCLLPVLLAVAAAVKLSSPGPVFFTQLRQGADGRKFRIFKFRTMRVHVEEAGVLTQASRSDPRITRVGMFLRRTSLDELPQFFNVLRGDMSVVGPRPHAAEHDELYRRIVNGYIHRYWIRPGITGWAQINGFRGETDSVEKMQRRVEHDLFYLQNWSFTFDMRIVFATLVKGFVHSNAY